MPTAAAPSPRSSGTLIDVLERHALEHPTRQALYDLPDLRTVTRSLTNAELWLEVQRFAGLLADHRGSRVMLVLENTSTYVTGLLGVMAAGCVAVNLLPPRSAKHLERLELVARDCGATVLFTTSRTLASLQGADLAGLEVVCLDTAASAPVPDERPVLDPDALACLQYTSGSTGDPRGVCISHRGILAHVDAVRSSWNFTEADHALSWLPLYHDMGLFVGALAALYTGFPLGLSNPLALIKSPASWLAAISDRRITFSGGPNFCYDLATEGVSDADVARLDLSCWRRALNGAEPVRAATVDAFTARFEPAGFRPETMAPGYGLAEHIVNVTTTPEGPIRRVTVDPTALSEGEARIQEGGRDLIASGLPIPGTRLRIVAEGNVVEPYRVGEIWLCGTSVADGYLGRPEDTASAFHNTLPDDDGRWLATGDLGFVDEHGHLFVTGRIKDTLVLFGRNHYPQDLEQTIESADPSIRPHFVAVFAREQQGREHVTVVSEVRRDRASDLDGPKVTWSILRSLAAEHEVQADEVWLVHRGQVPKTTSGKIRRASCRAMVESGAFDVHHRWHREAL